MKIVIGTRGSQLALAQAYEVRDRLAAIHPTLETEIKIIKTQGDKRLDLALDASGDKGLFTRELETALLAGDIDIAVHSLKDLPIEPVAGTYLSAILPREDAHDCLLGDYTLATLPQGAVIGTSSPRRASQLLTYRPDLNIRPIRGNVETRIAKLKSGDYQAIVMAVAGLNRLGIADQIAEILPLDIMVPAPGQAAIAIHQLCHLEEVATLVSALDCPTTRYCVESERYLLSQIGGGCAVPLGCHCSATKHNGHNHSQELQYEMAVYYGDSSIGHLDTLYFAPDERDACIRQAIETYRQHPKL